MSENEKKVKRSKASVKDILNGNVLIKDIVTQQLPFIIFVVILAIFYIGNRFHTEKLVKQTLIIEKEVKELRTEKIAIQSELTKLSRQSEIAKMISDKGMEINESVEPPKKIVLD